MWRTHPAIVLIIWLPFIMLDGLYLSSALVKVPNGAWFTILLAVLLASFFSLWRYGKEKQWTSEATTTISLRALISPTDSSTTTVSTPPSANLSYRLDASHGGAQLTQIKGLGIFFDKSGTEAAVPAVYEHFAAKFEAQMAVVVFLHLRALSQPHVHEEERYAVARTALPDVYRLTLRHGYNDRVITPDLGRLVYAELRAAIVRGGVVVRAAPGIVNVGEDRETEFVTSVLPVEDLQPSSPSVATAARLRKLDDAFHMQTLFLVGKEQLRIQTPTPLVKRGLLGMFLWVRENTRQKVAQLDVPVEKLVEVGFVGMI